MKRVAVVLLSTWLVATPVGAVEPVSGVAKARDASTIAIGGVRVRLADLLAAPADRNCGSAGSCEAAALALLGDRVDGKSITCTRDHRLGHGFYRGRCTLDGGEDPALTLLGAGLATAEDGAPAAYREAAEAARTAGTGLHAE